MDLLLAYHSKDFFTFEAIRSCNFFKILPALTGRLFSKDERGLLALPIRLGGLGIVDPQTVSDSEFAASEKVTSPLVTLIPQQKLSFSSHVVDA